MTQHKAEYRRAGEALGAGAADAGRGEGEGAGGAMARPARTGRPMQAAAKAAGASAVELNDADRKPNSRPRLAKAVFAATPGHGGRPGAQRARLARA